MSFLQPFILWGLPLVLLPIVIHMLNRMRHRTVQWAAMMFLISANRSSTKHAKVKQLLILACRVLAVLLLILALSRPTAGGWLGWMLTPAPDVILVLLDRSSSMESTDERVGPTKRQRALQLLAESIKPFQQSSRLVLMENVLRSPEDVAEADVLPSLSITGPTDTSADIPAMLQSALNWLEKDNPGRTEIWIASDLQKNNWMPEDHRWQDLSTRILALPQQVSIRLIALNDPIQGNNTSVSIHDLNRKVRNAKTNLELEMDLKRNNMESASIPVSIVLDGAKSSVETSMKGQNFRLKTSFQPTANDASGWGKVELPADVNRFDNTAYFVYGKDVFLRSAIISADIESRRLLRLCAAPSPKEMRQSCETVALNKAGEIVYKDLALLIWQDAMPPPDLEAKLRAYVEEGGQIIFFPTEKPDGKTFMGLGWMETQNCPIEKPYRVSRWIEDDGILKKTEEGSSLPLTQLEITKRQLPKDESKAIAWFEDNRAFITCHPFGKGRVYFCASLPNHAWSNLGEGPVLLPAIQRLLHSGGKRMGQATFAECGDLIALGDAAATWTALDSATAKNPKWQAGAYRLGDLLLAVNRPALEDELEKLDGGTAKTLFGALPVSLLEEKDTRSSRLQGEMWRFFLFAMAAFLLIEGLLILPPALTPSAGAASRPSSSITDKTSSSSTPKPKPI